MRAGGLQGKSSLRRRRGEMVEALVSGPTSDSAGVRFHLGTRSADNGHACAPEETCGPRIATRMNTRVTNNGHFCAPPWGTLMTPQWPGLGTRWWSQAGARQQLPRWLREELCYMRGSVLPGKQETRKEATMLLLLRCGIGKIQGPWGPTTNPDGFMLRWGLFVGVSAFILNLGWQIVHARLHEPHEGLVAVHVLVLNLSVHRPVVQEVSALSIAADVHLTRAATLL